MSEASKRDILHFFNVAPEKIVVVYNAIDDHFWLTPPEEEVSRTRERYQASLLFDGDYEAATFRRGPTR